MIDSIYWHIRPLLELPLLALAVWWLWRRLRWEARRYDDA